MRKEYVNRWDAKLVNKPVTQPDMEPNFNLWDIARLVTVSAWLSYIALI